jgi:hypothetical protein
MTWRCVTCGAKFSWQNHLTQHRNTSARCSNKQPQLVPASDRQKRKVARTSKENDVTEEIQLPEVCLLGLELLTTKL